MALPDNSQNEIVSVPSFLKSLSYRTCWRTTPLTDPEIRLIHGSDPLVLLLKLKAINGDHIALLRTLARLERLRLHYKTEKGSPEPPALFHDTLTHLDYYPGGAFVPPMLGDLPRLRHLSIRMPILFNQSRVRLCTSRRPSYPSLRSLRATNVSTVSSGAYNDEEMISIINTAPQLQYVELWDGNALACLSRMLTSINADVDAYAALRLLRVVINTNVYFIFEHWKDMAEITSRIMDLRPSLKVEWYHRRGREYQPSDDLLGLYLPKGVVGKVLQNHEVPFPALSSVEF